MCVKDIKSIDTLGTAGFRTNQLHCNIVAFNRKQRQLRTKLENCNFVKNKAYKMRMSLASVTTKPLLLLLLN